MKKFNKNLLTINSKIENENSPDTILLSIDNATITSKTNNHEKPEDKIINLANFLNTNNNIKLEKITILELLHCQLTDLPITFENLNLRHLDVSHNKLKKVPACIHSGLKNLEYLNLGHNFIQYFELPPGCLLHIKTIKLNNNLFENIPKWITHFQSINLEELNFTLNDATNYRYNKNSYNMHLMKLKKLKLRNSRLRDEDFDFLKCLQYLEYLDISNKSEKFLNRMQEIDDLFVKLTWKQLKVLKLNNLGISIFPEGILWVETLSELYIRHNYLSWFPDGIEFMVNLKILDLSDNALIAIPDKIKKLDLLEVLLASGNCIEVCPSFNEFVSLKVLDLYDNLLDDISVDNDNLDSFDADQNYFDPSNIHNYEKKKNNLRKKLHTDERRTNEQKLKQQLDSDTYSNKTEYSNEELYNNYEENKNETSITETEDWDSPAKIWEKNPAIDSADENWEGEEKFYHKKKQKIKTKIYVEDEDWMFEDAEEDS